MSESGTRQNTFTYSTKYNLLSSATMMAIGCDPRCARFSGMKKPLRCDAVTESALHLKWLCVCVCVCIATNKFRSHKHKNTLVTRTRTHAHITVRVRLHNGPVLHGAFGGLSLRAALSVCVCVMPEREAATRAPCYWCFFQRNSQHKKQVCCACAHANGLVRSQSVRMLNTCTFIG